MPVHLFTYWEGPRYGFLDITRALVDIYSKGGTEYQPVRLGPGNLAEWIGPLHPFFHRMGRYAVRSDYVRIEAVHRHGGAYMDCDSILLRAPRELIQPPGGKGSFYEGLADGGFAAPAGAPVMDALHTRLLDIMDRWPKGELYNDRERAEIKRKRAAGVRANGWDLSRSLIGRQMLLAAQREDPQLFAGCHFIPKEQTLSVRYDAATREYLLKPYANYRHILPDDRDDPSFLHLYGGGYVPLRGYSAEEILQSDHPVAYFLNTALLRAELWAKESGYAMPDAPSWARAGLAAKRLRRMEKAPASHPQYDLFLAVEAGDAAAVRQLIPQVPATDHCKVRYAEAVFTAFLHGRLDLAEALLQAPGLDINRLIDWRGASLWKMRAGGNLLHFAVDVDQLEALDFLLGRTGIDVNQRNDYHLTPLMFAAKHGRTEALARLLQAPGLDLHAKTPAGETALSLAADDSSREMLSSALSA